MGSKLKVLSDAPLAVGAAAVYPHSVKILEQCSRISRYEAEPYNLARVVGPIGNQRVWVPRNMAPSIPKDLRRDGLDVSFVSKFVARNEEQTRVIDECVSYLTAGRSHMVQAPTGFGKTVCAMDIIAQVGKKTLVVVTKEDIKDQWVEHAQTVLGLSMNEIGFIQGDICLVAGKKLVIAFIQSLSKINRYPAHVFNDFGLAIWDECHRVGADHFSQSCFAVPARLRLGISATPDRSDGKEELLRAHIGPLLVSTELAPMTPRVIAHMSPWQIPMTRQKDKKTGKSIVAPMPHAPGRCGHVVNLLAAHRGRNELIVRFVLACYNKGRKILIQSDTLEHLDTLTSLLGAAGIPMYDMALYVGGMSKAARDEAKKKRIILATYQMTKEATDIPTLDTLVMATPKSDVRQIVGRIIRFMSGKLEPLVFDIVDASSSVFKGYWNTRREWYKSIGAPLSGPN